MSAAKLHDAEAAIRRRDVDIAELTRERDDAHAALRAILEERAPVTESIASENYTVPRTAPYDPAARHAAAVELERKMGLRRNDAPPDDMDEIKFSTRDLLAFRNLRRESPMPACSIHNDSEAERCVRCEAQGFLPGMKLTPERSEAARQRLVARGAIEDKAGHNASVDRRRLCRRCSEFIARSDERCADGEYCTPNDWRGLLGDRKCEHGVPLEWADMCPGCRVPTALEEVTKRHLASQTELIGRYEHDAAGHRALTEVWKRKAEVAAEALVTANEMVCRHSMPYGWPLFQQTCGLPTAAEVLATPVPEATIELGRKAMADPATPRPCEAGDHFSGRSQGPIDSKPTTKVVLFPDKPSETPVDHTTTSVSDDYVRGRRDQAELHRQIVERRTAADSSCVTDGTPIADYIEEKLRWWKKENSRLSEEARQGFPSGVAHERRRIVAWLREYAAEAAQIPGPEQYEDALRNAADAIEQGDDLASPFTSSATPKEKP